MRRWISPIVLALALALPSAGRSEELVSGISQDVIHITSNYTGGDITVFGAIERLSDQGPRAIIVVVRGPDSTMTVRKKDRVAGIWINRDKATFLGLPAFYFVASTGPLGQIASNDVLEDQQIGLRNLEPKAVQSHHDYKPFLDALLRTKQRQGLFTEAPMAVENLGETLFRVRVPIPTSVPRGDYTVQVYLFRQGQVVSVQSTPLFIDQTGLERRVFNFAHDSPLAYGVSAVFIALFLGWLSSVLFRQNL